MIHLCNTCGCKDAESFESEWDFGDDRESLREGDEHSDFNNAWRWIFKTKRREWPKWGQKFYDKYKWTLDDPHWNPQFDAESFEADSYVPDRKDLARMGVGLSRKQKDELFLDIVWVRLQEGWPMTFYEYAPDYADKRDYTPVRTVVIDDKWYGKFTNNAEMLDAFESLLSDGKFEHKYGKWDRTVKNTINEHMIDNQIWDELYSEDYDYRENMYYRIQEIKSKIKDAESFEAENFIGDSKKRIALGKKMVIDAKDMQDYEYQWTNIEKAGQGLIESDWKKFKGNVNQLDTSPRQVIKEIYGKSLSKIINPKKINQITLFDAEGEGNKPSKISGLMLANPHWIPMYKKTKKEGESFDAWYERFMFRKSAESFEGESPMMKNITAIGVLALAILAGKKLTR